MYGTKVRIRILSVPVTFTEDDHGTGYLIAVLLYLSSKYKRDDRFGDPRFLPFSTKPCVLSPDDHRPSLQQQAFKASRGTRFSWHELFALPSLFVGPASRPSVLTAPPYWTPSAQDPVCKPILATTTLRHQLHGQVAGAMSILAPCANRTKARPCRSYQDRPTAGRLLLSGESFECLHPSFLAARHLCCTRPPDCHVCRSQPRNKRDRRTSFQRRAQLSYIPGSSRTEFPSASAHGPLPTGPQTRLCSSFHS